MNGFFDRIMPLIKLLTHLKFKAKTQKKKKREIQAATVCFSDLYPLR